MMTNLLSIDTTADICSIALQTEHGTVSFHESRPRQHAKILLPEVERLLHECEISVSDLNYIVFGRGPGSFTGVRIAAGVTQGLAFSADCPVLPISTLQSVAFSARAASGSQVWVALDARMNEVYAAGYQINEAGIPVPVSEERVLRPSELDAKLLTSSRLVGNGWLAGYPLPVDCAAKVDSDSVDILLPDARDSLKLANLMLQKSLIEPVSAEQAIPVYLRDNVTWDNKPKIGS